MKELQPNLLLNNDEYVLTWVNLLTEFYSQGITREIIDVTIELKPDMLPEYSTNLSVIILTIGMLILKQNARIPSKVAKNLEAEIAENFCTSIYKNVDKDFIENWKNYYFGQYRIFSQIIDSNKKSNRSNALPEVVAFARILTQNTIESNEPNIEAMEKLSIILFNASDSFSKLASNSGMSMKMFGKPSFVIKKM